MAETRYTYAGAARRVRRDESTIKRWRREGMAMSWDDAIPPRRVVAEEVLLAEYRERLRRWPIHQQRRPEGLTKPGAE
ncbi:hypothetical protein [Leucobacter sp. Psy1]|uniref:hypothetical protein n=1 Tax=Leucobacter sp. Psy1 TaxID=2875729 RepID=UPI001CD7AF88|nr:hypothetical protein [Leucobacter sp. Psy1]